MRKFFSFSVSFEGVVDLLVWGVSCAGVIFALYKLQTYNDSFVLWSAIGYIIGLFSIIPIFRSDAALRRYGYKRLGSIIELLLAASLVFNGFGTLGWYLTTEHYDDFVHFITPAMITWGCGMWYVAHIALKDQVTTLPKKAWWVIAAALAVSLVWEPTEFITDKLLGTTTYGQPGQPLDTLYDITMDVLGVVTGWLVFLATRVRILRWIQRGE